jgi:hypothetical protein
MSHSGPWPRPIVASLFGGLLSLFRGVWLTLGSLALFLTSSGAQEDLDRGKTPAQLYASTRPTQSFAARCRKNDCATISPAVALAKSMRLK